MGKLLSVIQFRNFLPFNFDEYPIFTNSGIESICFLPAIGSIAKYTNYVTKYIKYTPNVACLDWVVLSTKSIHDILDQLKKQVGLSFLYE